ncbi:MAG: two-component system response regulator [Clostridiales bacterium GWB2_37_7]|nr:MAG: two-component system response regulator [Clostridiales bacterium GWB2_37_7]
MRSRKPILLVEDDYVDVMTVKRALREINLQNNLVVAENGEQALEYLEDPSNERPGIILLDLNMPRMGGLEFLQVAKSHEQHKIIPIIVLTTSSQEKDRVESFKMSVAGYMTKPVIYTEFIEVVKIIDKYWTCSDMPIC